MSGFAKCVLKMGLEIENRNATSHLDPQLFIRDQALVN